MKEVLEKKVDEAKEAVAIAWKGVEEAKDTAEADPTDENRAAYNERYGKYDSALKSYNDLDAEFKTELRREIERLGRERSNGSSNGSSKGAEETDMAARLFASPQYKSHQQGDQMRKLDPVTILTSEEFVRAQRMRQYGVKTLVTSEGAPGDDILRATRLPGITPLERAPLTLLDLFSTGTTDGNTIEWVKIVTETNSAAVVPEATSTTDSAANKPESGMTVTVETTPYKTIAHYIPITRAALADMGEMETIINNFLIDGVRRELLDQAINGNDLDGIYDIAGLSTTPSSNSLDSIFRGVQAVRNAFFEPNAIALNPNDWTFLRLQRDDSGAGAGTGGYLFGPPSQAGDDTLWGLRVVSDPALTQGRAIVGKWDEATLYTRQGVQIHTTDSHDDWFRRNIIAILAEGRFALVTRRPNAFCVVSHSDY